MASVSSTITLSLQTLGVGAAISALKDVGDVVVDTAVKMDRMNSMMTAASGSAKIAGVNMDFVRSIAQEMGVDILASADSFAKLTASTRGTRLEGQETKDMFEALTAANTKLGGSTDDLKGMINAFSQMVSKGTVSMEELRGQLGERLPGAMKMAADAMHLTTAELIDQVSNGKILAEDLLPKLADAINNTYNDGKFDTAQSNINRLDNSWTTWKQNAVDSSWVSTTAKSLALFVEQLTEVDKKVLESKDGIEGYFAAMGAHIRKGIQSTGLIDMTAAEKTQQMSDIYIDAQIKLQEAQKKGDAQEVSRQQERITSTKHYLDEQTKILAEDIRIKSEIENGVQTQANNAKKASGKIDKVKSGDSAESAAKKAENEYQRMIERFADLSYQFEQDRDRALSNTAANEIDKINEVLGTQIKAEKEKLRNAQLRGEQQIAAEQKLSEVITALTKKAEVDKQKILKENETAIKNFVNEGEMYVAKAENNKLRQIELTNKAAKQAINDHYDTEMKRSGLTAQQVVALEQSKNRQIVALEKNTAEEKVRISGTYGQQLTQRLKDNYADQGTLTDQFNSRWVDVTMSATDTIANGFADMAVNGKASWADMAQSIIKSIEMMIAKMLIMYAIQQMVGMAGGAIGGQTGFNMQADAGQNPFNGTGAWARQANGGAWDQGVQMYANGDVFDTPTGFKSSKGLGVMGEAGPEAVMPLSRGADGKLGVRSSGGSGGGVSVGTVQIVIQSKNDNPGQDGEEAGKSFLAQVNMMRSIAKQEIGNQMRTGNQLNPLTTGR